MAGDIPQLSKLLIFPPQKIRVLQTVLNSLGTLSLVFASSHKFLSLLWLLDNVFINKVAVYDCPIYQ